jgi:hypothetical protein
LRPASRVKRVVPSGARNLALPKRAGAFDTERRLRVSPDGFSQMFWASEGDAIFSRRCVLPLQTPCDFAKARYVDIGRLRKSWGTLWIILGAVVVLFLITLIVSIVFFLHSSWLPAATSALGTIVSGAATGWVTTQRKVAVEEDEKAFADLVQQCGSTTQEKYVGGPGTMVGGHVVVDAPWFEELQAARRSSRAARHYLATLRGE